MNGADPTPEILTTLVEQGECISDLAIRFNRSRGFISRRLPPEVAAMARESGNRKSALGRSKTTEEPAPEGFAELAARTSSELLCKHYGRRRHTIARWRRETGATYYGENAIPASVLALSETRTVAMLARHFGWDNTDNFRKKLARQWPEAFERAKRNRTTLEIPDAFAVEARTMTVSRAARVWSVTPSRIRMWTEQVGGDLLQVMLDNAKTAAFRSGRATGARSGTKNRGQKIAEPPKSGLDDRAMDFIRKKTRWVCYSSKIYGATQNVYYIVGSQRLDLDGLVALAKKHGFE